MASGFNLPAMQLPHSSQINNNMFDQNAQLIQHPGQYLPQMTSQPMHPIPQPVTQFPQLYTVQQMQPVGLQQCYAQNFTQQESSSQTQSEEWQLVENKKRSRNSPGNHYNKLKQKKIDNYWLNTPTSNRFNSLTNEESEDKNEESEKNDSNAKPPPIFIAGVKNIQPLNHLLNCIAKENHTIRVLSQDQVKVQAKTTEIYDEIIKALDEKRTEYHTYRKKQDKPFRVVLRHLHPTTNLEEIKTELQNHGHTVEQIINIRQRTTKNPLPLFYVDLKANSNNKDIYNLDTLLNAKVNFEPPKPKRELVQCIRCQRYGHTKNFCLRQPRCVKCAQNHASIDCPRKTRSDNVKCVLCDGNHPANYRGCTIYKQLQKESYPALRKKEPSQKQPQQEITTISQNHIRPGVTYSHSVSNIQQPNQIATQQNDIQELKQMMKGLMEQMSTMLNLLTTLVSKMG